jgi:hypothetical protein
MKSCTQAGNHHNDNSVTTRNSGAQNMRQSTVFLVSLKTENKAAIVLAMSTILLGIVQARPQTVVQEAFRGQAAFTLITRWKMLPLNVSGFPVDWPTPASPVHSCLRRQPSNDRHDAMVFCRFTAGIEHCLLQAAN